MAVVTGANSGVGKEATRALALQGWSVVMVCRSPERGLAALDELRESAPRPLDLTLQVCDLSSLEQVRALVPGLLALPRMDALVNNAGLFRSHREITPDGFERTMAVNHLAHFLLTLLLEDRIRSEGARVVNVSSEAHRRGRLGRRPLREILQGEGRYRGVRAYGDSKLANVLFTREIARRWGSDGVRSFSLHPGVLSTEIWDRNPGAIMRLLQWSKRFMDPPSVGGEAAARLATSPEVADRSGEYFDILRPATPSRAGRDPDLARSLWEESAAAVGLS